ncbi:MAG: hypothetical protein R3350_08215, partial [Saprospiraceae bacterium]|nr:hypothetical protein [Saprospiraceae bacterium]
ILEETPWTDTVISGSPHLVKYYFFTSFDTGRYSVPPIPVIMGKGGTVDTLYSNRLSLTVNFPSTKGEGLAPIKPIMEEPLLFSDVLPWLIGILVLIALFLLYRLWKSREKILPVREPLKVPPYEWAIGELRRIDRAQFWQQARIVIFYSEVSYVVRRYLEEAFGFPALESTTRETLDWAKNELPPDTVAKLKKLLETADLVKFAGQVPQNEVHPLLFASAKSVIEECHLIVKGREEEE